MSWQLRFLGLAKHIAAWSRDPSTKVGAVIIDQRNRVVSLGFNGFPRGIADDERLAERDLKYEIVVHAEANALLFAKQPLEGCTIYTWPMPPCSRCASLIIQAGIDTVFSPPAAPRWHDNCALGSKLFREAGVRQLFCVEEV